MSESLDPLGRTASLGNWPADVVVEMSGCESKIASARGDRLRSVALGEVSFRITDADVRYLRWRDQELVRRMFVSVRDTEWREIPPSAWASAVRVEGGELRAYFQAFHTAGAISFRWRGLFTIDVAARRFAFEIDGAADHDADVNRVSLVVLHPLRSVVGGTLTARGPSGTCSIDASPFVHPQPIIGGAMRGMTPPFTELDIENDASRLEFRLSGALFEIEDQRNYGDASFKSYSPPLSNGTPYRMTAAHRVHQSVHAAFSAGPVLRLPALGLDDGSSKRPSSWTRARWFDYRRVDLSSDRPADQMRLQPLASDGGDVDAIDDVEVRLVSASERAGDELLAAIGAIGGRARSILLSEQGSSIMAADEADHLRNRLRDHGCRAPILVAVDGHFAELNRGLNPEMVRAGDGVGIVVCPTVHGGDVRTIAENVPAVPDMVLTARQLTGAGQVLISHLTLERGPQPDRAVYHQIAPTWLVATFEAASRADTTSITLDARVLPAVFGDDRLSTAWSNALDLLARARRSVPRRAPIVAPADVHAICWSEGDSIEMLLANLSDRTRWVTADADLDIAQVKCVFAPFDDDDGERAAPCGVPVPGFGVTWAVVRR